MIAALMLAALLAAAPRTAPPAVPTDPAADGGNVLMLQFPVSWQTGWVEIQYATYNIRPLLWRDVAEYRELCSPDRAPCTCNIDQETGTKSIVCRLVIETAPGGGPYDRLLGVFRVRECRYEYGLTVCDGWQFEPGQRVFK